MRLKPTSFLLPIFALGTVAKDDVAWKHGKDVVNLTKDSFEVDITKKPHFVMYFEPG